MKSASFVPSRGIAFSSGQRADARPQMKRPLAVWSAASGLKIDLKNEHYSAPGTPQLSSPSLWSQKLGPQSSRCRIAFPERDFPVGHRSQPFYANASLTLSMAG